MEMFQKRIWEMHNCDVGAIEFSKFTQWEVLEQARKLQATLVRNYDPATDSLTGVRCGATSVAKN